MCFDLDIQSAEGVGLSNGGYAGVVGFGLDIRGCGLGVAFIRPDVVGVARAPWPWPGLRCLERGFIVERWVMGTVEAGRVCFDLFVQASVCVALGRGG
eukprot:scaffold367329_cov61-Attheya_sp.AAC.1